MPASSQTTGSAFIAAAAYLDTHGPIESRAALGRHPFIGYIDDLIYAPELDYVPLVARELKPRIKSSNLVAQMEATRAGAGVCASCLLHGGCHADLVPVLRGEVSLTRTFYLVTHTDMRDLPACGQLRISSPPKWGRRGRAFSARPERRDQAMAAEASRTLRRRPPHGCWRCDHAHVLPHHLNAVGDGLHGGGDLPRHGRLALHRIGNAARDGVELGDEFRNARKRRHRLACGAWTSVTCAAISLVAFEVWPRGSSPPARRTEKPLPASPARAASMWR